MRQKPHGGGDNEPSLELPTLSLPRLSRKQRPPGAETGPEETTPRESTLPPSAPAEPAPGHDTRDGSGPSWPPLPGRVAAAVTGVVVGLGGALLTYLGMAGCEAVRGTSSCGGGAGLLLLVAILVLMILLGAVILKAWKVSDPGSTSFLAVALVTVVVLVALTDVIFSVWMFLLVPVISAASYVLSHWVTTRFVDEPHNDPPPTAPADEH